MRPRLLSFENLPLIGDLYFNSYTVFLALAFLIGVLLPVRKNYQLPAPHPITPIGGIWVFVGAMLGAKLYWIIQYDTIGNVWRMIYIWEGGLVFFGGLIGGALGAILYLKLVGAPVRPVGDLVIPYLALAHGVARIGCFLNGCCWGGVTQAPWAVHYPQSPYQAYRQHLEAGLITPDALSSAGVHPTQLYSTAGLFLLFFLLRFFYKRPHFTGQILLMYPMGYGLLRFTTEFFRGDSARPFYLFTASQTIALLMFLISLGIFLMLKASVWSGNPPLSPEDASRKTEPGTENTNNA